MLRIASALSSLVALTLVLACGDSGSVAAGSGEPELVAAAETPAGDEDWTEPGASVFDGEDSPLVLRTTTPETGDFDAIHRRGVLRVLVTYSRTNFFIAKGKLRGFEYELFRELGEHLEATTPKGSPPPIVAFLPVPLDDLIPALLDGRGDVAAAALTVTPERAARVDFTDPYLEDVDEILVAHAGAAAVAGWADLGGEEVFGANGSSYAEHLAAINVELAASGRPPIIIRTTGRGITTEDILEMVSNGALQYTVADRYLVELWAEVLDGLRLQADLTLGHAGQLAWAVRPDSPRLKAMLDEFVGENRKGTLIGNVLFKRYHGKTDWLRNPLLHVENSKLAPFLPVLREYSEQYGFDWRLIAAQAYQESRLDPAARSHAGAIGLMQLLP